jgi:import inner membrane translocase subunit TIM50
VLTRQDLNYLNRPINKIILLDTKESHAKAQPENAIILPPWKGDPEDRELLALIPFLEYVSAMGVDDVREALKTFNGKDVARTFAQREAAMRAEIKRMRELEVSRGGAKRGGGLAGLLGGGATGAMQQPLPDDKTIFDLIREEGMRRYRAIEKEIKDNGEKWLRDEAEMMKKFEETSAKDMKQSFLGGLSKWVPFAGDDEQPKAEETLLSDSAATSPAETGSAEKK